MRETVGHLGPPNRLGQVLRRSTRRELRPITVVVSGNHQNGSGVGQPWFGMDHARKELSAHAIHLRFGNDEPKWSSRLQRLKGKTSPGPLLT
jgi:hypothetical protein